MSALENAKTYTGKNLETIFFRPMLSGPSAIDLGVRVLYNMPVPTTVQMWEPKTDILQKFTAAGWSGGAGSKKLQKTIPLNRVKAELGYSAADYFSLVYELITNRPEVNMEDLTGTELEEAETTLFKQAIAESIRSTMWVGDTSAESGANTFDGFLKTIATYSNNNKVYTYNYETDAMNTPANSVAMFDDLWKNADERLKDLKAEGQLAFFVSSDVYSAYEKHLDSMSTDGAYTDYINGRQNLLYHGIPVVDLRISSYLAKLSSSSPVPKSFCILTDRRNLVLAVNTADFPGTEIRMWYNPDLMENRQRATFMAAATCSTKDWSHSHRASDHVRNHTLRPAPKACGRHRSRLADPGLRHRIGHLRRRLLHRADAASGGIGRSMADPGTVLVVPGREPESGRTSALPPYAHAGRRSRRNPGPPR